jgi:outer membrane protein OmpA-like peptidoglycan-associated protein
MRDQILIAPKRHGVAPERSRISGSPGGGILPIVALQRSVGNRAVTKMLQRACSGDGCCERCRGRGQTVQRQGIPAPAGPTAPPVAAPPAPTTTDANSCPDPAEQTKKEAFRNRTDLKLKDHIPSVGLGKFDVEYGPKTSKLAVTVKLHFTFTDDASAPRGWELLMKRFRGEDLSAVMWDEAQRSEYRATFSSRVQSRWSGAHVIRSAKPCWVFSAVPAVRVAVVDDPAAAHFKVNVHKSAGPIDYKSAVNNEHLIDPTKQPTADFYQSDNREEADFNSAKVATTERKRLDAAISASGASRLLFDVDSAVLRPGSVAALRQLAAALNQANPSAPLIPIVVQGFASSEGQGAHNADLALRRAQRVSAALTGTPVRQPVGATGMGPVGSPRDVNNRAATVATDTAFETTYATNKYSVSEHEFGHMLGNPDEYSNATTGPLGGAQTRYTGLVTSAGMSAPTFGEDTSSQMSNGVDVLPRHYVTLWEALAKMTAPDLTQSDWKLG